MALTPTLLLLERRLGREQEYIRVGLLVVTESVGVHDGRLDTETSVGNFRFAVSEYVLVILFCISCTV